jgi:hypothetical protein
LSDVGECVLDPSANVLYRFNYKLKTIPTPQFYNNPTDEKQIQHRAGHLRRLRESVPGTAVKSEK